MEHITKLVSDIKIPKMVKIRQNFIAESLEDVARETRKQILQSKIADSIKPGMSIAITAGSRGIDNIALILKVTCETLAELGAKPFLIPAMGSHGGATAEGQKDLLKAYGITEKYIGFPILSTMETVPITNLKDASEVRIDKFASEADGIVIVNRIKTHTSFHGKYESGLLKMIAIGLGKQEGAEICHARGYGMMEERVVEIGHACLANCKILFGIGIVENAYDKTMIIEAMTNAEMSEREPELLLISKANMPRIMLEGCDVLVVDEIGKNISGIGADPNITGVYSTPYCEGGIKTKMMVVLDLSDETHGNAVGIGLAGVTTRRVLEKIDFNATYANPITNNLVHVVKIPLAMENQKAAIQTAIKTCYPDDPNNIKLIHIRNTLELSDFEISEALVEEASKVPDIEIKSQPYEMKFNEEGNLF